VVDVRAVGVAGTVGEGVVLAVVRDPRDDRPLDGGRPQGGEDALDERRRLEGSVREQPVEAHRDAQAREDVHDQEDEDVVPAQPFAPDLPGHDQQAEDGQDGDGAGDDPVACLVLAGLDVVDAGSGRLGDGAHESGQPSRSRPELAATLAIRVAIGCT
jgi:hypothetical protein